MTEETTTRAPQSWRERLRGSRAGTLVVLAVTAALVMGGAFLVTRPDKAAAGTTAVTVPKNDDSPAPKVGAAAQDFTATTVDGKKVSLGAYKGHPVWLTFGASWCTACQAEAPDIEAAYKQFAAQGVVVLQVNISEDAAAAKDYSDRIGLTYQVVADPNSTIAGEYRVSAIPAHFFIDGGGVLRSMRAGGLAPDDMTAALTEITR